MKKMIDGWRARIGVLTPPNYTLLSEWQEVLPEGVAFVPALMPIGDATAKGLADLRNWAVSEAKKLSDWMVDIILFGCTSGSFVGGVGYDEDITKEIVESVKIPATTTTTCVIEALQDLDVKKMALVGPYVEEVFELEVQFFNGHGIDIPYIKALGYSQVNDFVRLFEKPQLFYRTAKDAYWKVQDVDCIFITCMASPSLEIIDHLERETGKPVLSSCSASLYGTLKKLRIREPVEGYGRLGRKLGEI